MVVLRRLLMCSVLLSLLGTLILHAAASAENMPEISEPIELLDVIEVTGTTVTKTVRTLVFSLPELSYTRPAPILLQLVQSDLLPGLKTLQPVPPRVLIDPTGKSRGRFTRVKPLKTERPMYPRMAREQGWQGTVVLRAHITADGTVGNATIQDSSGFSILDESAVHAVQSWTFKPAQNGEFQVASIVDLPIRFDLLR